MNWLADHITKIVDVASATVAIATVIKILPPVAAAFSIIWTAIQVSEWASKKWNNR